MPDVVVMPDFRPKERWSVARRQECRVKPGNDDLIAGSYPPFAYCSIALTVAGPNTPSIEPE